MNEYSFADMFQHRHWSEELHETPWWQALMADPRFQAAYERNHHMRLKMSNTHYLKKLMRSESERQSFVAGVLHPAPDHLSGWEMD